MARFIFITGGVVSSLGKGLSSAALGALLEVLQSFTAFRSAELADLIADALGALVAYAVLRRLAAGARDTAAAKSEH